VQDPRTLANEATVDGRPSDQSGATDARSPSDSEGLGYRGVTACHAVTISYRQLDYGRAPGLVVPSIRDASGSGTQRLYSFRDMVVLKVVKRLLDAGVSLQNIRKGDRGAAVAGCGRSGRDHVDFGWHDGLRMPVARRGRRAPSGWAGRVRHCDQWCVQGDPGLAGELPAEPIAEAAPDDADVPAIAGDELAARRARRRAG